MLDIACGKSDHSSALLNINLKFQLLECVCVCVWGGGGVHLLNNTASLQMNRNRSRIYTHGVIWFPLTADWLKTNKQTNKQK